MHRVLVLAGLIWTCAAQAAITCGEELDAMLAFLRANDAGLAPPGLPLQRPVSLAQRELVADGTACTELLRDTVARVRPLHLGVTTEGQQDARGQGADATGGDQPTLTLLSATTLVLRVPAFDDGQPLHALLVRERAAMQRRPVWLIDVRGNGGGNDGAWGPLLGRLGLRSRLSWGVDYLATPANAEAQRRLAHMIRARDADTATLLAALAKRLDAAPAGSWVPMDAGALTAPSLQQVSAQPGPRVVAILADRRCASSCEEFLLAARQSWRVKLFGQPTAGALDISNLRPQPLPSGHHVLWYATSRSQRASLMPVDDRGIAPDVLLPVPADAAARDAELRQVRRIAERAAR